MDAFGTLRAAAHGTRELPARLKVDPKAWQDVWPYILDHFPLRRIAERCDWYQRQQDAYYEAEDYFDATEWWISLWDHILVSSDDFDLAEVRRDWSTVPAWDVLPLWERWAQAHSPQYAELPRELLVAADRYGTGQIAASQVSSLHKQWQRAARGLRDMPRQQHPEFQTLALVARIRAGENVGRGTIGQLLHAWLQEAEIDEALDAADVCALAAQERIGSDDATASIVYRACEARTQSAYDTAYCARVRAAIERGDELARSLQVHLDGAFYERDEAFHASQQRYDEWWTCAVLNHWLQRDHT